MVVKNNGQARVCSRDTAPCPGFSWNRGISVAVVGVTVNVVTIAAVVIGNDRRPIEVLVEFDNRNCGSSSSSSDKCCNTQ